MLLNTWLAAAKRQFFPSAGTRRFPAAGRPRRTHTEQLETRSLLTALVVNPDNQSLFTNASGGLVIGNSNMAGYDELVIEGINLGATSGNALTINLSGIPLNRLAIESVVISNYSNFGTEIDLVNVTGLRTFSIEDTSMTTSGSGRGLDINFSNTDVYAVTIDDSVIQGIRIDAMAGSDIAHAVITENRIDAKAGVEGILLNVTSGTADNFRIDGNTSISSPNRDFVRINSTNSPMDGLQIVNNIIGTNTQGSGLVFRADGDPFVQPFQLTNNSTRGERLQTFVVDLSSIGLEFDINPTTGKPFTSVGNSGATTGLTSAVLNASRQILTLTFTDFDPGEVLQFNIDIDYPGAVNRPVFGDDLIGANITGIFTGNRTVAGQMIGVPNVVTSSQFAVGPGVAGSTHGINLNLTNSPLTNIAVTGNSVAGAPGHAFFIDAKLRSDITGVISGNELISSGRDGLRLGMSDSNFTGAVLGNNLSNNGGNGLAVLPVVTKSGLVEAAFDNPEILITSTNHGLITGDEIIIQGMVNHFPTRVHPGNGRFTITRINNNQFKLNGVSGVAADVLYKGGGAWYKPEFTPSSSTAMDNARGFVTIDMQNSVRTGVIRNAQSVAVGGPIVITSPNHGFIPGVDDGKRVRISRVRGNTAANGVQKITVIDADTFSLDGTTDNGTYDAITAGFGVWTANPITAASPSGTIEITSPAHGLQTGDQIRITGVQGNTAANGTFTVSVTGQDTFLLNGSTANGAYTDGGTFVRMSETANIPAGSTMPGRFATPMAQRLAENTVTNNGQTGILIDLSTGTRFLGDVIRNIVSENNTGGIHIESHSYGLGTELHTLDPTNLFAVPGPQDISFDVNIGTSAAGDGNMLERNTAAGIIIEALDYGTGSFRIHDNVISTTRDDLLASTPYQGDGIVIRLTSDRIPADAVAMLSDSIIEGNTIGVDDLGNAGHGLSFVLEERTRIQDLRLTKNFFLNNGLDGFHFERREDARLKSVVIDGNRATNNGSDGISIFATNTTNTTNSSGSVPRPLEFSILDNRLESNKAFGARFEVLTDAALTIDFNQNTVTGNGTAPNGTGYHPNDGTGNTNKAGGIGLLGFQQVAVDFRSTDNIISSNIGDGFSVDAFNFFDTLRLNTTFIRNKFENNSLTGFRNHGAAFGSNYWTDSSFSGNGEDGVRYASIEDKTDYFERRVGGADIEVIGLRNTFSNNVQSGLQLGMGVSGVFGDGTIPNANYFDGNGEDGLKITQGAGFYLARLNTVIAGAGFMYGRQRHITANTNFFRNNLGDGIDIGHFAQTEGGNVEHGDEVITDTHVSIAGAVITGNRGDGIEYLADSVLRISPVVGGGQDVDNLNNSSLSVRDSRIANNQQRGIDILNRHGEDSVITVINNQIFSNTFEGIYVMNTASHLQRQTGPTDPLLAHLELIRVRTDDNQRFFSVGTKQREVDFEISPNIELRIQDNNIQSNGTKNINSVVPVNESINTLDAGQRDETGIANTDWTHKFTTVQGTLGGLVLRVGAVDSASRFTFGPGGIYTANPDWELGLSGIDAEIFRNFFSGNVGADVYLDSYTSQIPAQTLGNFDGGDPVPPGRLIWNVSGYRDPLARLDLVFRENRGDSLDLTNGFAFLDNSESEFKSRERVDSQAPNHSHNNNPDGFWFDGGPFRFRNQQRTAGFFNTIGDNPTTNPYYWQAFADDGTIVGNWSFDGWGTSTWRVESDFETANFPQTNPALGFSDFYQQVNLSIQGDVTQWDTGTNITGFVGQTDWSLQRGDIFNVRAGQNPIVGDSFEENDNFAGASNLGTLAGVTNVNSLATNGTLSLHVKGDRDYYSFIAGSTGTANITVDATDANGDRLVYMLYEVDTSRDIREQALLKLANGLPSFVTTTPGGTNVLSASVVAGKKYVVEVFSNEQENVFASSFQASGTLGKSFNYGTARTYQLTIGLPAAPPPGGGGGGGGTGTGGGGGGGGTGSTGGSLPGPPTAQFTAVSPDPRSTAVGGITLEFREDVTGVDLTDFRLTRDGVDVPLTALAGASVTQVTPYRYVLNVGAMTGEGGNYTVTLVASGSGIRDTDNLLLTADATDTWTVVNTTTTFSDTQDAIVGDGNAVDVNGNRSLRAAVMEANASPGNDVIVLSAGTYTLSLAGRFEDAAKTGDLDITGNLTIRGVSAGDTIINAQTLDRIFHVFPGVSLILENLTIQNGEAFDGGAILNRGTVTLRGVNVINSEAYSQGGGIYNLGVLNVLNSSISLNQAGSRGGAVDNRGTATFTGTTISTNNAVSRGGGVFNEDAATSRMINVTIANNHAGSRAGGFASEASGATTIGNSILDDNTTDPTTAQLGSKYVDFLGRITSLGNNLVGILDNSLASGTAAGLLTSDRFGRPSNPLSADFNALSNSGGNGTYYHPLQRSGKAVDRGNNALYPVPAQSTLLAQRDQIGNSRLMVGNDPSAVTIDIGAIEHYRSEPLAVIDATPNPAGAGETITFSGARSTHTDPSAKQITEWLWDFDFTAQDEIDFNNDPTINKQGFVSSASGVTATHSYSPASLPASYRVALLVRDNSTPTKVASLAIYTIVVDVPAKPQILRPSAQTTDKTPTFRWQNGTGKFSLVVDRVTSGGTTNVITQNNLTVSTYTPTTPLPVGRYRVQVTATNASGSTASDYYFFDIVAIDLQSPVGTTFDITPLFGWTAVAGSSSYEIWVNRTEPSFINKAINVSSIATNSYEAISSLGPGTFTWWVRALDSDGGLGDWSPSKSFTIGRPSFSSPGAVTLDSTPTFSWNNLNAARYELWVNKVGGQNKIIHQTTITGTSYTPTTPLPNGTYDAWVRAVASNGEPGLWSLAYRFQMDFRVGPTAVAPSGIVTVARPVFTWGYIEGVTSYDLWVDNLSTGQKQVIRVTNVPQPTGSNVTQVTYTPTFNLTAGNYRWWVSATAADGSKSAWSTATNFTIPVPAINTPRGLITNTNTPQFQWSGVDEFVRYELWVDNLSTGVSRVIHETQIVGRTYTPTLPLENGNFRAWIRGYDAAGNASQWSGPADFTISASINNAPTGQSPRGTITANRPTFTWQPTTNAATYQLLVKQLSANGQPTVIDVSNIPGTVVNGSVSYTTTVTLAPGQTYRWWVRGVSTSGNPGPWSQPLDFRVVSNDGDLFLGPNDTTDGGVTIPVVATIDVQLAFDDEVRSISAHPAGTIIQLNPEALMEIPEARLPQQTVEAIGQSVDVDALMAEWADGGLITSEEAEVATGGESAVVTVTPATPNSAAAQDTDEASHAGLGLLAGLLFARGRRTSRNGRKNDE